MTDSTSDNWPEWADEIISPITGRATYYSQGGHPISFRQWAELREDRQVALTEIGDVTISTVWLGLDQGHPDDR